MYMWQVFLEWHKCSVIVVKCIYTVVKLCTGIYNYQEWSEHQQKQYLLVHWVCWRTGIDVLDGLLLLAVWVLLPYRAIVTSFLWVRLSTFHHSGLPSWVPHSLCLHHPLQSILCSDSTKVSLELSNGSTSGQAPISSACLSPWVSECLTILQPGSPTDAQPILAPSSIPSPCNLSWDHFLTYFSIKLPCLHSWGCCLWCYGTLLWHKFGVNYLQSSFKKLL